MKCRRRSDAVMLLDAREASNDITLEVSL